MGKGYIRVWIERYRNDNDREMMVETFGSLVHLESYIFRSMRRDFRECGMYIPTPAKQSEASKIEFQPMYDGDHFWVLKIERDGMILFSNGEFTAEIPHWSKEVQEWLTEFDEHRKNPHFFFED